MPASSMTTALLFDNEAEMFNNFRTFYTYVNPLYTEEQLEVFFEENKEYENEFEGVDHLPWQLLPFWVEECPPSLQNTTFSRNCNVAIAFDLGVTAEKYIDTINGIILKKLFCSLLFLKTRIENLFWHIRPTLFFLSANMATQTIKYLGIHVRSM